MWHISTLTDVYCSEPTSGLDSKTAFEVISAVKAIVGSKRICLTTIHQPSQQVFDLFDRAILVSSGRIIYSGKASTVKNHFNSLGFKAMSGENPAEYLIKVCGDRAYTAEILQLEFQNSGYYTAPHPSESDMNFLELKRPRTSTSWTQFRMLLSRGWTTAIRDYASLKAETAKNVFFGVLIGATFFNNANISPPYLQSSATGDGGFAEPTSTLSNFLGIFYFAFIFLWFGNTQYIPSMCAMDRLYRRELAAGTYTPGPYTAAALLVRLPFQMLFHTIFIGIMYPMCGFDLSVQYFFYVYIILFFVSLISYFFSLAFAAKIGNAQIAFAVCPPFFFFFGLFCGYPILLSKIPPFWVWAPYISFLKWAFEGLLMNEFGSFDGDDDNTSVAAYYAFAGYNPNDSYWILILFLVGTAALVYYGMQKVSSKLMKVFIDKGPSTQPEEASTTNPATRQSFNLDDNGRLTMELDASGESRPEKKLLENRHSNRLSVLGRLSRLSQASGRSSTYRTEEPQRYESMRDKDFHNGDTSTQENVGMTIEIEALNYTVPHPKESGQQLRLLKDISVTIRSGCMTALMGASGAGKSTFSDVVTGRKTTGVINGSLLFNGEGKRAHMSVSSE